MSERASRVFCAVWLLCVPGLALAYTDPGTGAYLVQMLIAFAGAAAFYLSHPSRIWRALRDKLRRRRGDELGKP